MTNSEINEAVARKLGWKLILDEGAPHWICPNCPKAHLCNPDYAGSIQAAWEIVEHMRKRELQVVLNLDSWGRNICSLYVRKEYRCVAQEEADTVPLTICLAFLKLP